VKKQFHRMFLLAALCGLLAAFLTLSSASAEEPSVTVDESAFCEADTAAADDSMLFSEAVPASDDEVLACNYASCRRSADCPSSHPAAPFFCMNNCCVPW